MAELIKPGTDNKPAGTYKEVGPRGGAVPKPRVVKIDQGDRLPPTQEKGRKWEKFKFIINISIFQFSFSICRSTYQIN